MGNFSKIMEELEEMNSSEIIEKLAKNEIKKEILIKILELKEKGKNDSEVIIELKNYLKED